ncbi:MAG: hypothetical protein GX591_04940 [Planctomycetes bacterium]|nr:hypothetical protein [Planctomycetota bacterium]
MTRNEYSAGGDAGETFDFGGAIRDIGLAIRQYRWMVVVLFLSVPVLVGLYMAVWPPVYRAEALVMLERDEDLARDEFYITWSIFRKEDARTEIEMMRSGPILKQVIQCEGLRYDDVWHPTGKQLRYFWEQSWPGRRYMALKEWAFGANPNLAGMSEQEKELGKTIDDLAASITIAPVGESHVGKVSIKGPSPKVAQVANRLMDVYVVSRMERYRSEAQKALDALTDELDHANSALLEAETRRIAFYRDNDVSLDFHRELAQVEQLNKIEMEMSTKRARQAEVEAAIAGIDVQLASESPTRTVSRVQELNALREAAKLRRLEYELRLMEVRNRYREDSIEVRELQRDIDRIDELLAVQDERVETSRTEGNNEVGEKLRAARAMLHVELASLTAGLETMESEAAALRRQFERVPALQAQLLQIGREQGILLERYQTLALKRAQAEVSLATANAIMPSMRIVGRAVPPASRSWPRLSILAPLSIIGGLLLSVASAVVRFQVSSRVHRSTLLRSRPDLPIYATVASSSRRGAALGRSARTVSPAGKVMP